MMTTRATTPRTFQSDIAEIGGRVCDRIDRALEHPFSVERITAATSLAVLCALLPSAALALNLLLIAVLVDGAAVALAYIGNSNRPYGVSPRFMLGETLREHYSTLLEIVAGIALLIALAH